MDRTDRNHSDVIIHLQMIQGVIARMGDNAFRAKQWTLITMAALFAVFGTLDPTTPLEDPKGATGLFLSPLVIWFGFYLIASYFIYLERRYRDKFDDVRAMDETEFDMSFKHAWRDGIRALFSVPNVGFYYLLALTYLVAFFMFANFGAAK